MLKRSHSFKKCHCYERKKQIIFGSDSFLKLETTPENEKHDIATGGEDIGDQPLLEDEEKSDKEQKGQGLKTMTPKQMIARLPILLAQLKAGNNSEKLKNEIRQLLYSMY